MNNTNILRFLRLIILPILLVFSTILTAYFIFSNVRTQLIHADYQESSIFVPDYKQIDRNNNSVTPNLIVGIGPKLNLKNSHRSKSDPPSKNDIVAAVTVNYNISKEHKSPERKQGKRKASPRPDWYINKLPKARREYLLKVRPKKVAWLKAFFARYNSPLKANVYDFVYASEYYGIDYRLLPAISIVESSGGKYLFRPYNPFGWGRHGYKSFHDAIWDVARGLSVYHYRLKRTTPESIGRLYNPVTPTHWARKVRYLMSLMPKY